MSRDLIGSLKPPSYVLSLQDHQYVVLFVSGKNILDDLNVLF